MINSNLKDSTNEFSNLKYDETKSKEKNEKEMEIRIKLYELKMALTVSIFQIDGNIEYAQFLSEVGTFTFKPEENVPEEKGFDYLNNLLSKMHIETDLDLNKINQITEDYHKFGLTPKVESVIEEMFSKYEDIMLDIDVKITKES